MKILYVRKSVWLGGKNKIALQIYYGLLWGGEVILFGTIWPCPLAPPACLLPTHRLSRSVGRPSGSEIGRQYIKFLVRIEKQKKKILQYFVRILSHGWEWRAEWKIGGGGKLGRFYFSKYIAIYHKVFLVHEPDNFLIYLLKKDKDSRSQQVG